MQHQSARKEINRPAFMTDQQYQIALGALAKARLEPFAYPHLANIVQDAIARDVQELSADSQRIAGYRPGAKPLTASTFTSSGRYHDLKDGERQLDKQILEMMADGEQRTALETAEILGASVDRIRRAYSRLTAQGSVHRSGATPARYRIAEAQAA